MAQSSWAFAWLWLVWEWELHASWPCIACVFLGGTFTPLASTSWCECVRHFVPQGGVCEMAYLGTRWLWFIFRRNSSQLPVRLLLLKLVGVGHSFFFCQKLPTMMPQPHNQPKEQPQSTTLVILINLKPWYSLMHFGTFKLNEHLFIRLKNLFSISDCMVIRVTRLDQARPTQRSLRARWQKSRFVT